MAVLYIYVCCFTIVCAILVILVHFGHFTLSMLRNGIIGTSGLKSSVTIVLSDTDFLYFLIFLRFYIIAYTTLNKLFAVIYK